MKRKVSTRKKIGVPMTADVRSCDVDDIGKPFGLLRDEKRGKWILYGCTDTTSVAGFEALFKMGALFLPTGEVFVGGQKVRQSDAVEARRHQEKMANELA
jgi:hypothetical protein